MKPIRSKCCFRDFREDVKIKFTLELQDFDETLVINAPDIEIATNILSNDPGKVDSNFFCYAATVLSPHRNVLIFTQRMHKPI